MANIPLPERQIIPAQEATAVRMSSAPGALIGQSIEDLGRTLTNAGADFGNLAINLIKMRDDEEFGKAQTTYYESRTAKLMELEDDTDYPSHTKTYNEFLVAQKAASLSNMKSKIAQNKFSQWFDKQGSVDLLDVHLKSQSRYKTSIRSSLADKTEIFARANDEKSAFNYYDSITPNILTPDENLIWRHNYQDIRSKLEVFEQKQQLEKIASDMYNKTGDWQPVLEWLADPKNTEGIPYDRVVSLIQDIKVRMEFKKSEAEKDENVVRLQEVKDFTGLLKSKRLDYSIVENSLQDRPDPKDPLKTINDKKMWRKAVDNQFKSSPVTDYTTYIDVQNKVLKLLTGQAKELDVSLGLVEARYAKMLLSDEEFNALASLMSLKLSPTYMTHLANAFENIETKERGNAWLSNVWGFRSLYMNEAKAKTVAASRAAVLEWVKDCSSRNKDISPADLSERISYETVNARLPVRTAQAQKVYTPQESKDLNALIDILSRANVEMSRKINEALNAGVSISEILKSDDLKTGLK